MKQNTGIYQIRNTLNNHRYIGSSVNLKKRMGEHFSRLRSGTNECGHLQKACNKYGIENFVFEILEYCGADVLIEMEQRFIDELVPEYNIVRNVIDNGLGSTRSEEARQRLSECKMGELNPNYGKTLSEEHRRKIGEGRRGKPSGMLGKHHSDETKKKISATVSGDNNPNSKARKSRESS